MSGSPPDGPHVLARGRAAGLAALGTLAVLLATVDARGYGLIPDGKEMLSAGTAIARFLEIGVSRDFVNAPRRPAGDAVSRYGIGVSLVEAIPAAIARATGAARTAPIFVLVPILCLAGCAWATARALGRLGTGPVPAAVFGAALVLATPLWGYSGSDYGEPLQALSVACSILALVELRGAPSSRRWQIVFGVAAGWAILTKTLLLLVVAPLLLCAVLGKKREDGDFSEGNRAGRQVRAKVGRAERRAAEVRARHAGHASQPGFTLPWPLLLSFAGILILWSLFEWVRFGRLGGGYAGETFTYPFFTGLLRLTLLPNKGLLWYAPICVLAVPGFLALRRHDARVALAFAASFLALLFASSAWWAWDGQAGWGPRLVVPALPALVVLAGLGFAGGGGGARVVAGITVVLGLAVNAVGALVPFPAVYALSSLVPPQPISEARAAGTPYEISRTPAGGLVATAPHHLSLTPAWSPIRVHALLLAARLRGSRDGALPELDPPFRAALPTDPAPAVKLAVSRIRTGWGRDLFEKGTEGSGWADPYFDALRDQLVRSLDMKDFARAQRLGEELARREEKIASNDPLVTALVAETLRLGRGQAAADASAALSYLSKRISSSSSLACHPWILFVRAMAQPPGDFACLPEGVRDAFAHGVEVARQRGWTLTEWNRAVTTGRP